MMMLIKGFVIYRDVCVVRLVGNGKYVNDKRGKFEKSFDIKIGEVSDRIEVEYRKFGSAPFDYKHR